MTLSRKSIDQAISPFYNDWVVLSVELKFCIGQEASDCYQLIVRGCEVYEELQETLIGLFGSSAPSPLNESERLEFVKNSRSTHAASRQLEQLFGELKKKIARIKVGYPAE
ncbi:hypothetical protein KQ939_02945 [Planococcus sp. CP5-4]|uniref:YpoC family protein n=1 Tax=unclassified Planococcus (in: firmicutes) TaxID=2662419 RepID=UPI001C236662|nr:MULTISPECIES: hypothetical protein [unclassified Planococcus (in: firmicutes)]MBU9671935.1 hypothetical protein [Planococcus sp. CP5-4_YE]MBV0907498.1 hypothetical protein [Planococcus sp. CP5-4_UN]MBW6062665.1 hypothetical protein [Planococcus sp. CP5-4]